jgi:hypothetical protein
MEMGQFWPVPASLQLSVSLSMSLPGFLLPVSTWMGDRLGTPRAVGNHLAEA